VSSHCFFSIREVASAAMLAGDMQAMTDVSEMAQELISVCEDAMTIIDQVPVGHFDPGTAGQRHYPELGTRSPLVVV
jgi:hypothetical protein